MTVDQRIPEPVQPLIQNYVLLVNERLPNLINAFYIVGSIALGEFNERFSDIDFVTVLNRRVTSAEVEQLRDVHRAVEKIYPRWEMSGSYVQIGDLAKLDHEIGSRPHYHDRVLHGDGQSGVNSITWWELKNHGIAVIGPPPRDLSLTIDWNLLISKMRENLNTYWTCWTNHPRRILIMHFDWGIQWAVLGVLRQLYAFRENSITTKLKAARYAINCLPDRWHLLIQEAIDIREGRKISAYRFKIVRTIEAVKFLKYMIQTCSA